MKNSHREMNIMQKEGKSMLLQTPWRSNDLSYNSVRDLWSTTELKIKKYSINFPWIIIMTLNSALKGFRLHQWVSSCRQSYFLLIDKPNIAKILIETGSFLDLLMK